MMKDLLQPSGPLQEYLAPFKGLFGEAEEQAVGQ